MKTLIAIISFLFVLNLQYASAAETKIWEDEEGVTHIEIKGSSTQKSNFNKQNKSKKYNKYKRSIPRKKFESDYKRNQRALSLEIERKRAEREREAEKKARQRELERAKRTHDFYREQEDIYRANYLKATSDYYRNYWYKKWQKARDEQSKYRNLLNKQ